ncbi:MAG: PEPxxWA-CTERM sorting domain-containing protein [Pseudomonadota bacterium]
MEFVRAALAAALLAGVAGSAQAATVVDFNELTHTSPVKVYSAPIVSKGFSFASEVSLNGLGVWGTINNADPDGATLTNWSSKTITVRRTDGEAFSFQSLDLSDTYDTGAAAELLFTFFDGKAQTTQKVTLDRLKGMQTMSFGQGRLEWFSIAQTGSVGMQIDNLSFGAAAQGGVPEPATWALMIMGFGAAGASLRRRRDAVA